MATEWDIREPAARCSLCEREFAGGEIVFSGLMEKEESFERLDCCEPCWTSKGGESLFSCWRTVQPEREKPIARRLNSEVVLEFFHRLEGEEERKKRSFRYVLALMLMRKKVMKLQGVERDDGAEKLVLVESRSGVPYRVADLHLGGEEIAEITDEISSLLNIQVGPETTETNEAT